ncbi:acetamidase/formamidase family protein [Sporomusa sphaeroides DSM 2875]|uniref:acetamidase/formamidase family protein n=1 Tax=Sporomusa sphaeroides TaxID=47679 RepID=UPI002030C199|nr:acetamidase/formamidase family protein [Sporomusa sphaeroides]MCM0759224.1 acetamidase/formamidase family protein [Sporomusa sphaeroides DSM 2875]
MSSKIVHATKMAWVLDPQEPMLGPVADGGMIVARVSPGCWGAMITPDYPSGHEVTHPIAVEGAEVGDAVALMIRKVTVLALATTSGTDTFVDENYLGDPFVAKRCPRCGEINPKTYVEGIGEGAIKCVKCNVSVTPFHLDNGYTMLFSNDRSIGVTVPPAQAEEIARQAAHFSAIPSGSCQYSSNLIAKGDMPGVLARVCPMIGNIGSCPAVALPSSHNAGDFGSFLINAPHKYAVSEEDLLKRTDGHMDINEVREGAILIVPVKTACAGIYVGDVHAMMGDGEIAGHTTDVSAEVILEVKLIKKLNIDGPILLPRVEDLPAQARLYTAEEKAQAGKLTAGYGFDACVDAYPVQVIGSGVNLNIATINGLERMAALTGLTLAEIKNRATITGSVEIGRLPGVVQITTLLPASILKARGLLELCQQHYG